MDTTNKPLSSSSAEDAYLRHVDRPLLTREAELDLANAFIAAEAARAEALLGTPAGREAFGTMLSEVAEGTRSLVEVLRNVDADPTRSNAQRRKLLGLRRVMRTGTLVHYAKRERLHPRALDRIEAIVREAPPTEETKLALEHSAAARWRSETAKRQLIEHNLRLVISYARKFAPLGLSLLDLVQEGNIGLMHAIEKFEPDRGYRLTTYASWWIKQSMQRALADRGATIRIPVHLLQSRGPVMRAKRRLAAEGNTQPTARELARRSGIPHQKVEQILALPGEPVSLDAPINGEADLILGDTIASDAQPLPEDAASAEERRARVLALVETLDPRERQVVTLRFGLDGSKDRTLEEVGEVLSLTRERIRQIESLALNKLKARCARSGFTFDLEK